MPFLSLSFNFFFLTGAANNCSINVVSIAVSCERYEFLLNDKVCNKLMAPYQGRIPSEGMGQNASLGGGVLS